jgi:hypothetical protein
VKSSGLFVAGVAFITVLIIAPMAQSGSMGNGSQQRNAVAVKNCLAMPHDKMMKDQGCKVLMTQHPELFPGGKAPTN